jgi:hypothetical protein
VDRLPPQGTGGPDGPVGVVTPGAASRLAGSSGSPGGARANAALAALFLLLVVGSYADPLLTHRTFIGRDIVPYDLPLEKAVHDAWSRGALPVWWDAVSGGRPLLPNPNAGVFYPPRALLSRVSFPLAARLFPVLHWVLGGWGMLALARSLGGSRPASWVAAASFTFSGVVVSEVFYAVIHPGAALLPWTLWALARPATRPFGRIVPLAAAYGLLLLCGDAFSLSIALLSALLWLVLEIPAAERLGRAAQLVGGLLVAGLLALPQIVATALVAPETRRMISGFRLQEALGFSIPPARLLELAVPYPFGPAASMDLSLDWGAAAFRRFFASFFVGPIALAALLRRLPRAPGGARFGRALTLACAALALAGNLVPASWRSAESPIPLRYPEKFMLGAAFGMALCAGIAVDAWRRERRRISPFFAVAAVLATAAVAARLAPESAGALATAAVQAPERLRALAGAQLPGALAAAGLLWAGSGIGLWLLASAGPGRAAAGAALLGLVPLAAGRGIAQAAHEGTVFPPTALARTLQRKDPVGAYRGLDESLYRTTALRAAADRGDWGGSEHYRQSFVYYTPSLWGRGAVFNGDLDAGDFSRFESLRRLANVAALRSDSAPFFASLSLRYGVRFRDQDPIAGFRPFGGDAFRIWDENPDAKPEIRLLERWREVPGPVEALAELSRLAPGQVVVESGRTAEGAAREGRVAVLRRTPETLSVQTESADPTLLFVLRGDWEYRTVLVDGVAVPVLPAQLAFGAVPVPAGRHRVEWRENAPGLSASRWGPVLGVGLLLLATARARRSA